MRTLFEIIEDVNEGKKPDYEEIRYALLAYQSMFVMDHSCLHEELLREKSSTELTFSMFKNALERSPKELVGWNNDPDNPEYQKFRKLGHRLFNKIINSGPKVDQAGVV